MFGRSFYHNDCASCTAFACRDTGQYNMAHKRRGLAVIINNVTFTQNLGKRVGSDVDFAQLMGALQFLGFDVEPYKDRTVEQMRDIFTSGKFWDVCMCVCVCVWVCACVCSTAGTLMIHFSAVYIAWKCNGQGAMRTEKTSNLLGYLDKRLGIFVFWLKCRWS